MKIKTLFLQSSLVVIYLVAIVSANITVAKYGAEISILTAFLFIGLNITTRDYLHEAWQDSNLKRNMFFLILVGSALSFLFNAGDIAKGSLIAFAMSESVDAIFYQLLKDRNKPRWLQVNGSNTISAIVDSFAFPYFAFGGFLPVITIGQIAAKIGGGFLWWGVATVLHFLYKSLLTKRAPDLGYAPQKIVISTDSTPATGDDRKSTPSG